MKKATWVVTTVSAVSAMFLACSTVFASSDSFAQQYASKSQQEASLWSQAQSTGMTSSQIQALENTVSNINTQVTALYNALQALDADASSIPQINTTLPQNLKVLQGRRQEIIRAENKAWNSVESDLKNYRPAALTRDRQQHTYWSNQLSKINTKIRSLQDGPSATTAPYAGARPDLEQSILHLEDSAIRYTNEIIQLEITSSSSSVG